VLLFFAGTGEKKEEKKQYGKSLRFGKASEEEQQKRSFPA